MGNSHAVNPRVAARDHKYYIFDWDDNILHMPTRIHVEKRQPDGTWIPWPVSTSVFAAIRHDTENYRPPDGDWEKAFREFRDLDTIEDNAFLRDTREALQPVVDGRKEGGPSFRQFRQALIEGRLFGIVTARGHSPEIIRRAVEYFIEHVLSDDERRQMLRNLRGYMETYGEDHQVLDDAQVLDRYLALNRYHGISSPAFKSLMGTAGGPRSPEQAKLFAIHDFVRHVIGIIRDKGPARPVSIGFSDDDPGNVQAVHAFIERELSREFPGIRFVLYDTSEPGARPVRKVVVAGQLDLGLRV